ncbi:hypothetical protein GE300_18030 [Rhodobacteraceae bacterium 2CG4]|uniref:Universal stress protein family protein n=1 Tax=Halovulum marinum TaxID=2662447 RepID=A0A6L5Z4J3_9RHOB|nr:hypothetical protein [Halovulum marinum]MSU91481.1 hypothetical protein [Halovulum marinum]
MRARRILIGASRFDDADGALRLAMLLAARTESEVRGIFVEEQEYLDLAAAPATRAVTPGGRPLAPPTVPEVRARLAADARAFEAALAQAAGQALRRWSFERAQGRLLSILRRAALPGDLLLIGHARRPAPGAVVLVAGAAGPGRFARDTARAVAAALDAPVLVALVGAGSAAGHLPGNIETFSGPEALLRRLDRLSVAAVVLDRSGAPFAADRELRRLIGAARCPAVLVGGDDTSEPDAGHAGARDAEAE